jgi:predicted GNAT superfamily acetyltransferase
VPISVEEATDVASCRAAAALFQTVWDADVVPVTGELLRALSHAGHYVALARDGDEIVGASFAVVSPDGEGGTLLHSHITGVLPDRRRTGVGLALKHHQRAWALDNGCPVVTWTFDPLVARNGWFNLACLGAVVVDHLPDFYGPMADGFNLGDETDRFLVRWDVGDAAAASRARTGVGRDRDELLARGAIDVVAAGDDGGPRPTAPSDARAPRICAVPGDVVSLRRDAPQQARAWQLAVREAAQAAIAEGFVAASMTDDRAYVFEVRSEVWR